VALVYRSKVRSGDSALLHILEQFAEAARVNQIVRQYLVEVEQHNPAAETVHQQEQVSTDEPYMPSVKMATPAKIGQVLMTGYLHSEPFECPRFDGQVAIRFRD
jgi:hypothetical protein